MADDPELNPGRLLASGVVPLSVKSADPVKASLDVIDLFSGCGGFSAGFRMFSARHASYRLAGAVDLNHDANETYRTNLRHVPLQGDVHAIVTRRSAWDRFRRSLDRRKNNRTVLVGGPPCQGFSSHRKTIDDCGDLNILVPDFARAAVRLDADAAILENVPELVTIRGWPYFAEATETFRKAGFVVRTRVYNLAGFGLPQERFRVLTLAMRRPFAMPSPFLTREAFRTVRQAIGSLPPIQPGMPFPDDPDHVTAHHRASTVATIAAVPRNGGRRPLEVGPQCLRDLALRNGRTGYDDVYGRLWWDRPAVTITGHSRNPASGRFAHPDQDRGLSVREAALLQGFPPAFRFQGSLVSRFLQLGNAVPPSVAAFLAGHILAELSATRKESPGLDEDLHDPVGTSFSRLIPGIKNGSLRL